MIHNDTGGAAFVKYRLADRIILVNDADAISESFAVPGEHCENPRGTAVVQ